MKKVYFLSLLSIIVLYSCKSKETNKSTNKTESDSTKVQVTGIASPVIVPCGTAEVVNAGKPKVTSLGKPYVVPANTNVHPADITSKVAIGKPIVVTIGSGDAQTPKTVRTTGTPFNCQQPAPTPALPMRTKDNAICNIQYLDIEMGMNGNSVNAVCEDKNGMVWIGTKLGGLSKYDGKSFIHYTTKQGFISNNVKTIIEDSAGVIWIGTDAGVCRYDGKSFSKFTKAEGLSNNSILCIYSDKSNNLWFGTNDGVSKYDGETITSYTKNEGMNSKAIISIADDKYGNIWLGTYNDGLIKCNEKTFSYYTKEQGLSGNTIFNILEDDNNNLWLGTENGISKFDNNSFTNYSYNCRNISCSAKDKTGNLWFGNSNGLVKYDGNSFTRYTEQEGLSNNSINSVFNGKTDNLWIGTDGGLNKYDIKSFASFEVKELSEADQMPIAEDKKHNLWIGTSGENTGYYDGKSFYIYTKLFTDNNKYSSPALTITKDKDDNIWFGTKGGGLYELENEKLSNYTTSEGLSNNFVNAIYQDKEGNLWIGTDGGVCKFDGKSFTRYTEKEGLVNNNVLAILEDGGSNIWFGTIEGLSRFDGKTFINYTTEQGLINNKVHSMLEDINGNIWFATESGVSFYSPSIALTEGADPFTNYSEKDGLSSNLVSSIIRDTASNIWITTNKGLDIISRDELENNVGRPDILNFTKKDGLKDNVFNKNSAFVDSRGQAWWGSAKAITTLDLNTFSFPKHPPVIQLTSVDLEQQFIDYNYIKDSLSKGGVITVGHDKNRKNLNELKIGEVKRFYNYPLKLALPYYLNYLTFRFSATDWQAPHKIQYQYMLQPVDKDWSTPTQVNYAEYRNLDAGHYTFKVQSKGASNKWSEPFEYSFDIIIPWYNSWYIRALEVCGVLVLILLIFNWRTAALRKNQRELERIVEMRTFEVVAEKKEVEKQKEVVEQKNKEITDSIEYALRIQSAILPAHRVVKEYLANSFILYKPKDIVAGDFYWMETIPSSDGKSSTVLLAACDCTGHGVPGAMVSVVCHNALNRAVREFGLRQPAAILDKTAEIVIESFSKSEEEIKDGMDISLASIKYDSSGSTIELEWAGANNALWLIRNGELVETKADKQPIGKYENNKDFTNNKFTLNHKDSIYLFTDGFADQFGGDTGGKKLTRKRFKDLILSVQDKPMEEQGIVLEKFIIDYRKHIEQVDDILVMGVKV